MPECVVTICGNLFDLLDSRTRMTTRERLLKASELIPHLPLMIVESLYQLDKAINPRAASRLDPETAIEVVTALAYGGGFGEGLLSINFPPIKIEIMPGTGPGRDGDYRMKLRNIIKWKIIDWIKLQPDSWVGFMPDIVVSYKDSAGTTFDQATLQERSWPK